MFGLAFRFPAGRYHATPWGRNANEADVAWPPEPWRILRALIACYWRKGDKTRWSKDDLGRLVESLAEEIPLFHLPEGVVHSHTRHYMPIRKSGKPPGAATLVFDAFLHLPDAAEVQVVWRNTTLDTHLLGLATDLAAAMGYLGRAESWVDCRIIVEFDGKANCGPAEYGFGGESAEVDLCRVLVPRSALAYRDERRRLIDQETERIRALPTSGKPLSDTVLKAKVVRSFRSTGRVDTLPARLVDALAVDTADLQNRKWDRPPAAYEVVYAREVATLPSIVPRFIRRMRDSGMKRERPTVARYLLAGRPRPRTEDAVKIGEVMRAAAMSKFGWHLDEESGRRTPKAPWQVSGRRSDGRPVRDPAHPHAFWLPEDADDDGWIDHIVVFIRDGMDESIRKQLDLITRIWLTRRRVRCESSNDPKIDEWRLALEGFGRPEDFAGSSRLLAASKRWQSVTPFLASGHIKKAGHPGELLRLLNRRGVDTEAVTIRKNVDITSGGTRRHPLSFHRFRSRGREQQRDASGAMLTIDFPRAVQGPLAFGYASHFGLGLFGAR